MLLTLEETIKLIQSGKILHIAADESMLNRLPKGNWIAGTTPYFITDQGGVVCKDKLFVDEITCSADWKIAVYDQNHVMDLISDAYSNGICLLILPFASDVTARFSKEAPHADDLLMVPTIGWVSGYDLDENGMAKVYDGTSGSSFTDKAVALHINLPANKAASLEIVNIFNMAENSPKIEFDEDTMSIRYCRVDGQKVLFADYLAENKVNLQLPLVTNCNGIFINVSIKSVSEDKTVELYAPVFSGNVYSFADFIADYSSAFSDHLKGFEGVRPLFSCNCILNYLYGNLEGKSTPPFAGPVTFGEIAYQLLNQTLVYAQVIDI